MFKSSAEIHRESIRHEAGQLAGACVLGVCVCAFAVVAVSALAGLVVRPEVKKSRSHEVTQAVAAAGEVTR